ncbi:glycosyltransferase family 2 protein [Vibrio breoganii]|uniref:glycosyltransferase family 2 protein n=1 Tax=Vibrio breoganii TaxID=553239 RepID=UPI000C8600B9|nr:glycosyltransferase family 2 protein [Vibrio breoganii]PMK79556.1 hypothetical protein BCT94_18815 [Vibrio breoganii]PML79946.1 hypothetical protein BCT68_15890 [Vibrio breoganii]
MFSLKKISDVFGLFKYKLYLLKSNTLEISIIIPLYNSQEFVKQCMDSILQQSFDKSKIEVIVIDDGSTDDSYSIVKKYEGDLDLIIMKQQNAGASAARNAGLRKAKGKFIFFVDSDDIVPENALSDLHSVIVKNKSDVAIGPRGWIKNDIQVDNHNFDKLFSKSIINKGVKNHQSILSIIAVHSKMFSRKYLIENNLFFKEGISSEDFIFTYIMAMTTNRISTFRGRNVYYYRRRHGESLSITQNRLNLHNLKSRFIQMDETYKIASSYEGTKIFKRNEVRLNFEHRLYRHLRTLKTNDSASRVAYNYIRDNVIKRVDLIENNCTENFVLLYNYMINNELDSFYRQLNNIRSKRER